MHIAHPHGRLSPQARGAFGLNPLSQLVFRYHWLEFLNQVYHPSSFNMNVEYKISKIRNRIKKNWEKKSEKIGHIPKNGKIDFSFVSEHCAWLFSKGGSGFFSIKDMQTPLPPSEVAETLWKLRNVLKRMRKMINNSPIFIFRVIGKFHNSKNRNCKNRKFGFSFCSADSGSFM